MKRLGLHAAFLFALLAIAGVASYALAGDGRGHEVGPNRLVGYQENPDISTAGKGTFRATINRRTQTISFKLSYSGLEGDVQQAHIHFGKRAVNGGRSIGAVAFALVLGKQLAPVDVLQLVGSGFGFRRGLGGRGLGAGGRGLGDRGFRSGPLGRGRGGGLRFCRGRG